MHTYLLLSFYVYVAFAATLVVLNLLGVKLPSGEGLKAGAALTGFVVILVVLLSLVLLAALPGITYLQYTGLLLIGAPMPLVVVVAVASLVSVGRNWGKKGRAEDLKSNAFTSLALIMIAYQGLLAFAH